jgi:tetratricopeptide (TPR) repeat protein
MTGKIITALTKIEAETHWSRGRLQEAMGIYTKLLSSSPNMTLNTRAAIESRIQLLRQELDRPAPAEDGQDIESGIQKLRAAIAADQSVVDLRRGVKQFYQKKLYADALENLKQLVRQNAADEFCINAVAACLVYLHTIEELPVAVDLFLVESFQNAEKAAQFKFLLAEKMAQKGHPKHAEALHRHEDRFTSSLL